MSDNNDFNFFDDDFEFKPISEGLGFNQNKNHASDAIERFEIKTTRKGLKPFQKRPRLSSPSTASKKIKTLPEVNLNNLRADSSMTMSRNNLMSTPTIKNQTIIKVERKGVRVLRRVFSWLVDMIFVSSLTLSALMIMNYFIFKELNFITLKDLWKFFEISLFLFTSIYIFYFSILWKSTRKTLGMFLMDLELSSNIEDEDINFTQTIVRAVLSVIAALSLGMTDILGLTNSLSWTKVLKKS